MQNEGGKGLRELFWSGGRQGRDAAKTSFLSLLARGRNDPIRIFSSFFFFNQKYNSPPL